MTYFNHNDFHEELEWRTKRERRTNLILVIVFLLILVFAGYVFWDRATEHGRFDGGTIVDKYRVQYGSPYVLVLKDGHYRELSVSNSEYLKYTVGDIYNAQE